MCEETVSAGIDEQKRSTPLPMMHEMPKWPPAARDLLPPPRMLTLDSTVCIASTFKGHTTGGCSLSKTVRAKARFCLTSSAGVAGKLCIKYSGSPLYKSFIRFFVLWYALSIAASLSMQAEPPCCATKDAAHTLALVRSEGRMQPSRLNA